MHKHNLAVKYTQKKPYLCRIKIKNNNFLEKTKNSLRQTLENNGRGKRARFYSHVYACTAWANRFAYIIKDQNETDLIANQNPFAIVVLANLYVLQSKDDNQKRLTLKEQIYKLAKERNYSNDKIESLILFLSELIKLPFDLEKEFTEHISKSSKSTDMPYITQTSRNLIDALAKQAYGRTYAEMDSTIINTIVQLYTTIQMTIEQIAAVTKLDVQFVQDTLKKKKLLKKKKP